MTSPAPTPAPFATLRNLGSGLDAAIDGLQVAHATKNNYAKILRAALNRVHADKVIPQLPDVRFKLRRTVQAESKVFNLRQIAKKIKVARDAHTRAILALGVYAGLRRLEVVWLGISDCDFDNGILHVTSKPGFSPKNYRERSIPMGDALARALKDHIALLPTPDPMAVAEGVEEMDWLFPSPTKRNRPLCEQQIGRLTAVAFEAAGLSEPRQALHRLRRSWATQLLQRADLTPMRNYSRRPKARS